MCSLGHHDDAYAQPSARVQRRRAETASVIGPQRPVPVRPSRLPRGELAKRRADKHAQLRADLNAEAGATPFDAEQFELIPPDMQQLPAHIVNERIGQQGEGKPFYWTVAAERD